ncbi:MAG: hypothetical protein AAF916_04215 [Planctomycetota bacterium]
MSQVDVGGELADHAVGDGNELIRHPVAPKPSSARTLMDRLVLEEVPVTAVGQLVEDLSNRDKLAGRVADADHVAGFRVGRDGEALAMQFAADEDGKADAWVGPEDGATDDGVGLEDRATDAGLGLEVSQVGWVMRSFLAGHRGRPQCPGENERQPNR